jgi:hypothetical protein
MLIVSDATRTLAGILLLTITTIQFGGAFMLRVVRGKVPATELQRAFFRAGHAHAGVLVMLALVTQLFVDASDLDGFAEVVARDGIAAAAILIPAGFFLSVARPGATRPSRLLVLLWVGVVSLAAAVVTLGIGLLTR